MKKFLRYIDKTYHITDKLNAVKDRRSDNKSIDKNVIMKMLFVGFTLKRGSLSAIFDSAEFLKRMKLMFGKGVKLPKLDAARDFIESVDPEELRKINYETVQIMRRNKVFRKGTIDGYVAMAIDGVELFSSKNKHCDDCLERNLSTGETEYYHSAVVAMTVGQHPHIIFGEEMLKPSTDSNKKNEGELTGANRLLDNLYKEYHHFADIIVGDELYFNAPFMQHALDIGIDIVIRIKNERRVLLQDALGIFNNMDSNDYFEHSEAKKPTKFNTKTVNVWDVNGFEMDGLNKPVRVLQFEEHYYETKIITTKVNGNRKRNKTKVEKTKIIWVVTTSDAPVKTIWRIMHKRWDIELNGFRDLKMRYNLDHCYHHRATEAIVLLIILAFNLREIYLYRRLTTFKDSKQTVKSYLEGMLDSMLVEPYKWYDTS